MKESVLFLPIILFRVVFLNFIRFVQKHKKASLFFLLGFVPLWMANFIHHPNVLMFMSVYLWLVGIFQTLSDWSNDENEVGNELYI